MDVFPDIRRLKQIIQFLVFFIELLIIVINLLVRFVQLLFLGFLLGKGSVFLLLAFALTLFLSLRTLFDQLKLRFP